MAIENFYTEEDENQLDVNIGELKDEFDFDESIETTPSILVVRDDVTRRISGVRSCGKDSRHQREAQRCLEDFLKDVIYEHRHLKYIDSKIDKISARWKNRISWDGKRSCSGSVTATCIARFQKE